MRESEKARGGLRRLSITESGNCGVPGRLQSYCQEMTQADGSCGGNRRRGVNTQYYEKDLSVLKIKGRK